jgi:hypothetical protein
MGGVEVSNHARVAAYVNNVGIPGVTMPTTCACSLLDDGFDTPFTDEAPWWEPTRPESAEFLGLYITDIEVPSTFSRDVSQVRRNGSQLSPLTMKGQLLQVSGIMNATSAEGMEYGQRWLREVLRGGTCNPFEAVNDTAIVLTSCPEESYEQDTAYRHYLNTGLVDGPVFGQIGNLPRNRAQSAAFILSSSFPYAYHAPTTCLDAEPLTGTLSCSLTTPAWMGEGAFTIDVTNTGTTDVTDLVIEGKISVDGTCPVTGDADLVPPSWTYTIPTLEPEDRVVIDGARLRADWYDASHKLARSALSLIDWEGPFVYPEVGPCTTMCLEISAAGGTAEVTVDTRLREA